MDALLLALAAPRRREILTLVRGGERSAGEIHRALGSLTFGAVSQHLAVLGRAGLVSVRREGRSRIYSLRGDGLSPLRGWLDAMWADSLDRLKARAEAEEGPRAGRGRAGPRRGAALGDRVDAPHDARAGAGRRSSR